MKAAGSTGNVGPNLDHLKLNPELVRRAVEHGGGAMPAFKGLLTVKQIIEVADYVSSSASAEAVTAAPPTVAAGPRTMEVRWSDREADGVLLTSSFYAPASSGLKFHEYSVDGFAVCTHYARDTPDVSASGRRRDERYARFDCALTTNHGGPIFLAVVPTGASTFNFDVITRQQADADVGGSFFTTAYANLHSG